MNKIAFVVVRNSSLIEFQEECTALLAKGGAPTGNMMSEPYGVNTFYIQAFIVPTDGDQMAADSETMTEELSGLGVVADIADDLVRDTRCNPVLAWKLAEYVRADALTYEEASQIADK